MDRVVLNVGGKLFHTTRSTLLTDPQSMLAKMFDTNSSLPASVKDETGAWFIDRDPKYFRVVLNFLRDPTNLIIDENISIEGVLHEALFFQIQSLIDIIQQGGADFTRRDICLMRAKVGEVVRFSGTRLNGLDLSGLHLNSASFDSTKIFRTIFFTCNINGANFTHTQGSNADFSETIASNAKFTEAQLPNCNFSKAQLGMTNFWLANLTGSTFSNADCTGTIFHKCDLTNVDFTNANLKQAKFQDNCYLSKSNLTGAKNIDWSYHQKMTVQKSIISQADYDAIPLSENDKILLKLIVLGKDFEEENVDMQNF